ncbi:MAG: glycosyltransferase family 2 protein [Streptococcaceae bacterium]|jgi:glycosyltransferase involved in cell wall biosynthesis|nr:glycosyltransferase family 2 protein [Streptococcaceae bacterium]
MTKEDCKMIDILFPYYGDVEMMKKAVHSVLNQTYQKWRLLVFDDGYPSDEPECFFTELIAKELEVRGASRIVYQKNAGNLGANGNYRKALYHATSEYYCMMGADDMMKPDFLEKFMDYLKSGNECDIYQPGVEVINEFDAVYLPLVDWCKHLIEPKRSGLYQSEYIANSLIRGDWLYFPSVIWKTAVAKKVDFNQRFDVVQDLTMALDIIQNGGTLFFDKNNVTFQYRRHSGSDSSVRAVNGYRFNEERELFLWKASQFEKLGWKTAARTAKRHVLSRLNALTVLPMAIRSEKGEPKELLKHVLR